MRLLFWLSLLQVTLSYKPFEQSSLEHFASTLPPLELLDKDAGLLLKPILKPRVSGTEGATEVLDFLKGYLTHNLTNWKVEEDRFTDKTPLAEVEFVNIIATMDPPGSNPEDVGHLVLAAHYDSKRLPEGFIGAIDSAAPCAILLYIAQMLSEKLPEVWMKQNALTDDDLLEAPQHIGVQLIFFDGEEAVVDWTETDSIYGARHLADEWESAHLRPMPTSGRHTKLQTIDLFVLLDLLGAAETTIPSYFETTHWAYEHLARIESTLKQSKAIASDQAAPVFEASRAMFHSAGHIGDDHMPFWKKGVEILHIIPVPFPMVWHTIHDDGDHLHQPSVNDLATLFSVFTAEWLELPQSLGKLIA